VDSLASIGKEASSAVPALLSLAARHQAHSGQSGVLYVKTILALDSMGQEASAAVLVAAASSDAQLRELALEQLQKIYYEHSDLGPKAVHALPELLRRFRYGDWTKKHCAAYAIAQMGKRGRGATPTLVEALDSTNPGVRIWAAFALAGVRDRLELAVPVLVDALSFTNDWGKDVAQKALLRVPDESVPRLVRALNHKNHRVRTGVEETLRKMGRKAIPALEKMLLREPRSIEVRRAMRLAGVTE